MGGIGDGGDRAIEDLGLMVSFSKMEVIAFMADDVPEAPFGGGERHLEIPRISFGFEMDLPGSFLPPPP